MNSLRFWSSWIIGLAIALLILVWALLQWHLNGQTQLVADRLLLLGELRRGAVQEYFATADAELRFWSSNEDMVHAQEELIEIWGRDPRVRTQVRQAYVEGSPHPAGFRLNLDDAEDGSEYSEYHGQMHASARLFVTERGYYDFFLISPGGDILYSVEKETDFATSLVSGPWKDSGLAKVFQRAKREKREGTIVTSDMEAYEPSGGSPAIFIATAMHDGAGEFIGVIAFQLPTDGILGIMNYTSGMGETGETYLVGQDLLMRSDSRFSDESTVLRQSVDTPTVRHALDGGESQSFIDDYRGVEVLSVSLPMEVGDTRWAVMAEIDRDEIGDIAARERPALTAPLLFLYGLSLWSVWYWRGRTLPEEGTQFAGLDFGDVDGGGMDG